MFFGSVVTAINEHEILMFTETVLTIYYITECLDE